MAHDYTPPTYGIIETPLGNLLIWCNGEGPEGIHLGYRTEADFNVRYMDRVLGDKSTLTEWVTLHRVDYHAHDHVVIKAGQVVTRSDSSVLFRGLGYQGKDWWPSNHSPAATKFRETVEPVVIAWLETDEGEAIVRAGTLATLGNDANRLEEAIATLAADLKVKRAALRKVVKRLDKIEQSS